jgi:alpha-galactosidase
VGELTEQVPASDTGRLTCEFGDLAVTFDASPGEPAAIREVRLKDHVLVADTAPVPLVEIGLLRTGRDWSSRRFIDSVAGRQLSYSSHFAAGELEEPAVIVTSRDRENCLRVDTTVKGVTDSGVVRIQTRIRNESDETVQIAWATSAVVSGLLPRSEVKQLEIWSARNDWLAENRWLRSAVRDELPDLNRAAHEHDPRGAVEREGRGGWPADGWLPLGAVIDAHTGHAVGWQIEHNGPWHWQVGERATGFYLSALGPTHQGHDCVIELAPGELFETVPVTLVFGTRGFEGIAMGLTASRRALRRAHEDVDRLPVIYNDYMNTLMGNPTTAALLPLIDAASTVGVDTFVIDAGWYAAEPGWWDEVGAWMPALSRFPGGIAEVIDYVTGKGMTAGLWLEPEMVGVRSPVARSLPDDAFFSCRGTRLVEHGRHHLDLSHPDARAHLDSVIDRLVDLGVGYLKLDYNVNVGPGTDAGGISAGAGLLRHNRAFLDWLDGVHGRHPGLTLENCASGGMRVDYATLARTQLQSTSDQQDPLLYPPIAAAATAAILPEQAANWAYPQPHFTDDLIAFTANTSMLGRFYLSGHLDRMSPTQLALVSESIAIWKRHRRWISSTHPTWPLGLPNWDDSWVAHGLQDAGRALFTIWRRAGEDSTISFPVAGLTPDSRVQIEYPSSSDAEVEVIEGPTAGFHLRVRMPRAPQSVTISLDGLVTSG